eukprot:gnl/TRDRNA2_/TRDRNA2_161775_c0_seq2.p1 gnl/TRDRNA2_/TRDRNA2_161775_c0~~gnl/TRDRNA2_/TRDRNA2_161775_c0_seq2.p1  ORF type:complete len:538 (+),score=171.19 gnl/TRDRNA2_/TRDRNA2_161775_c0_seq2:55-1668(+)
MGADDAEAANAADDSEEELEVGAQGSGQGKKKKKNKKKKKADDDEKIEVPEPEGTSEVAKAEEAAADDEAKKAKNNKKKAAEAEKKDAPEEDEEDGEEGGAEDAEEGAATKKKRRPKKKKGGAAAAEDSEKQPEAEVEAKAADGDGDESGEEEGEGGGEDVAKKKKKKKKKSKAGGEVIPGAMVAGAKEMPDAEFEAWYKKALEATSNGVENMSLDDRLKPPRPFWGYQYTGLLRPAYVAPQMKMPEGILMPDYATDSQGIAHSERLGPKEFPVLEGEDLKLMREACALGREVLDIASRFMRAGVTGDEIDRIVYQACVDRKIYPSPLNYFRFPKCVCVSPNEVICHGIPDSRPIQEGDIVNLDVSVYHKGFHADLNETFFIGKCEDEAHLVVQTAYNALLAACRMIRPGTFYRDLGNAIHAEATKANCAVVTAYCGHGVGKLFHGPPKVPHYRKNKAVGIMKPGHVFTVEPMINVGSNGGDKTWPDNWTAVTRDGKRSSQFEHTFLVTETGVELLTARRGTNPTMMPPYDAAMFQR